MERIGFIGLGKMGAGICNRLITNGKSMTVYDINQKVLENYEDKANVAGSADEVLLNSDYIFLSLPSSEYVEKITGDFISLGVEGKIIIDLSTSFPFSTQKIYDQIKSGGGHFIDAGLSGTPDDCVKGTLMVLFGGDKDMFSKLESLMKIFCNRYKYMGGSGFGHLTKLVLNYLGLSYAALYAQIFPLTEKMGLDNELLGEVVANSNMGCGLYNFYSPKVINKTYNMDFAYELAHKDLTYCKNLFEEFEVPAFSLEGTLNLLRVGIKDGRGKHDYSECAAVMYDFFNKSDKE